MIGVMANFAILSYYSSHTECALDWVLLLGIAYLLFYFWERMFGSDTEGLLDTRCMNMVGLFVASSILGLYATQVLPLVFTGISFAFMIITFVSDAVSIVRQLIRIVT